MADLFPEFRQHGCRISSIMSRGHDLIVLENSAIRVVVARTKGADILELRYKRLDLDCLARTSNNLSGPGMRTASIGSARGTFLDHSYLGWQEVLPNGGPPSTLGRAELGTHGEVSMLEWSANIVVDEPERIAVRFTVDLQRTPFRLERTMEIAGDSPEVIFHERVSNVGEQRQPFMWGHHPDFGAPLLAPGAIIDLSPGTVSTQLEDSPNRRLAPGVTAPWPHVPGIDGNVHDMSRVRPKKDRVDDSFYLRLDGDGWAALRNPELKLGVALLWDAAVFPYVWCWAAYGGSFGYPHYGRLMNLAIEPFTSPIAPLHELAADHPDEVRWLDPDEVLATSLRFLFLTEVEAPFVGWDDHRAVRASATRPLGSGRPC